MLKTLSSRDISALPYGALSLMKALSIGISSIEVFCINVFHIYSKLLCVLLIGLLSTTSVNFCIAQGLNKQKLTASYLYNFAKNIEWPDQDVQTSFDIGVYGTVNPALMVELGVMRDKVKLRGLPIRVKQLSSLEGLNKYHMVYLEDVSNETIATIYNVLDGKPVLLVTSGSDNKQLVMINLVADEDHLKFEVNRSNIINHGLTPLPELILNGGTEIDVAKLYREGQASLINLQRQLSNREKTLNDLTSAISKQQRQMLELTQNIQKSDAFIAEQKNQLQLQEIQIDANEKEREKLLREVEQRTEELDEQQLHLNVILREISEREQRLVTLDSTIKEQESTILSQKKAIVNLDELVNSQNVALRYLWGSVFLGILLIITAVIAYTIKRRDNQRLAVQTQDLQIARDRLAIAKRKAEDASQAKSEFLSLMSHELRTPLQAIIGYTEVVIEELKLVDDDAHITDLERVILNSERLLKLINGVLDLAKIESGRMDLDLTEVKLSSLVNEAIATVSSLVEKNSIRLKTNVEDGDSLPLADPEKLLHILINLLGNAIKFSANGQVSIEAIHKDNQIYMSVADTGIGISPEQQARIFDPFKQADTGNARKFQGSGLGLSITRQLCDLMGGNIRVESQAGVGSTFIVEIPLPIKLTSFATDDGNTVALSSEGAKKPENGKHIVMIDDDPSFLDIMARTITAEGYQVHTAATAAKGWNLIQSVKPDLITLDLRLPDEFGWVLFERIKADSALRNIPVIIISMMEERKRFNKNPADEYLTKPIKRETLKLAIQQHIN